MSASRRWSSLSKAIADLRSLFLPVPFDALCVYSDTVRVQAFTRAFIVLCHAEIEGYLEGWAKDIARSSETVCKSSARVTEPMAYLLATLSERVDVPTSLSAPNAKDSAQRLAEASTKMFQKYYKNIKDNHGIK